MRPLVLFHGGCNDGFCAAWIYRRYVNPQSEFKAVQYNTDPPDTEGRDVIILDFSYERPLLMEMEERAQSLLVLDHHETAERELEGLDYCIFAQDKSGARMTWEHFFDPRSQGSLDDVPWLVAYTEDRDLWKWELANSKAVNAALASYPRDFSVWDSIAEKGPQAMASEGEAILRFQHRLIRPRVKHHGWTTISGFRVPITNATFMTSEIGNALADGHSFSVVFFIRPDSKVVYNLRSKGADGADVGSIARAHGGGGHKNAAAFTLETMLPIDAYE
ncbi:MAG: phosphohydrolase [Gemmatimonadetes bacterium]|jgi:oligoribonuclease NrnB/cAMP/cGMP phosphodiesterase (DHH superfamily)|nr:phosphohydrolase [Gemmatimonadota bacterium]|tara:strand:- start:145 stop:972 length:828 start_codon:yes stop_codon:yes gene_type:complete